MNRNFVIAGGTKGIGLELVRMLEPDADNICVYSRSQDKLTTSEKVSHYICDFTSDEVYVEGLPDAIHGVAYCPGSINLRSFRSLKPDDFRRDLEVNLIGAVRFLQACLSGLKKGADEQPTSVVLFSTVAVAQGMPMHSSVAAAKGAIEGLTRSLAAEWAPTIRVNCLAPALTETELAARFFEKPEARETMAARYPLRRTGLPKDLAAMAGFLLLPDSGWITGQVIGVDGGMSKLRT
ncbi:MAG: SDR family oxidoreductase [Pirellulaceae bacterium]